MWELVAQLEEMSGLPVLAQLSSFLVRHSSLVAESTSAALCVPDGLLCAYRLVPKQRWQPSIATNKSRMFVV